MVYITNSRPMSIRLLWGKNSKYGSVVTFGGSVAISKEQYA